MARRKMTEKQEETLKRMQETRKGDTMFLREKIAKKLEWAIEEKKKGIALIEKQLNQIRENKEAVNKLDGAILALTELLQTERPKEEIQNPDENDKIEK